MGLVERVADPATGSVDYLRTEAAVGLEPALNALAEWAQCHVDAETALCTGTVSNLMWNLRNHYIADALPRRRLVIQFRFADPGLEYDTYWALVQPARRWKSAPRSPASTSTSMWRPTASRSSASSSAAPPSPANWRRTGFSSAAMGAGADDAPLAEGQRHGPV